MAKADDPFSMLELLIGLPNVRVLSVDRVDGELEIHLETAEPHRFCPSCGIAGVVERSSADQVRGSAVRWAAGGVGVAQVPLVMPRR